MKTEFWICLYANHFLKLISFLTCFTELEENKISFKLRTWCQLAGIKKKISFTAIYALSEISQFPHWTWSDNVFLCLSFLNDSWTGFSRFLQFVLQDVAMRIEVNERCTSLCGKSNARQLPDLLWGNKSKHQEKNSILK